MNVELLYPTTTMGAQPILYHVEFFGHSFVEAPESVTQFLRAMTEQLLKNQPGATPEKHLLTAILRRALFDYANGAPDEKASAAEWFFAEEDGGLIFTFDYVCSHLGFDPQSIRSRLRKMPRLWDRLEACAA